MESYSIVDGRYVLEAQLAEGGMGQVFRARHVQLGKVFALKVIAPAFADDDYARQRFNQEAKLASQISHPNIVSVVDFGEDPAFGVYMVMELVEGVPLVTEDERPMSIRRALDLLGQLADVLEHIHIRGIIHGDIKADNVLITEEHDGRRRREVVRLLDFGLAQRHGAQSNQVDATPHYAAPERVQGGVATEATDIYALGVLGYQLLSGKLPFDGMVVEILMAQLYDEAPAVSAIRGEPLDPAIEALIKRAMAKDPAERHSSAAAFRYELNNVMDMLALTRKRHHIPGVRVVTAREVTIELLFDKSTLPQAVIADGVVQVANRAFAQLVGVEQAEGVALAETSLVTCVPDLLDEVQAVCAQHKPATLHAFVDTDDGTALDLAVWLAPFSSTLVHVLVRYDVLSSRQQDRERGAFADGGTDVYITAMSADDFMADREAEAGAVGTRREERLENAR
jgi:tRNA A-37 threonylcarbamoyl transferase component Bud32